MNVEKIDLSSEPKFLTIQPKNEIRDKSGNLIKEITLEVFHGTGMASEKSWIDVKLYPELSELVESGGWQIIDDQFVMLGGEVPQESSLAGQLKKELDIYFKDNPTEFEELKRELNLNNKN